MERRRWKHWHTDNAVKNNEYEWMSQIQNNKTFHLKSKIKHYSDTVLPTKDETVKMTWKSLNMKILKRWIKTSFLFTEFFMIKKGQENHKYNETESEFNEFTPRLKSLQNRFQLSAGLNLEKLNTVLSKTNHIWAAAQIL